MSYISIGPIGYEQTIAVHQAQQVILDSKARSFPLLLERTDEPVWQEDESRENQMRADRGEEPTPFFNEEDANAALRLITVALPDRLQAAIPKPDSERASTETSHVGLQIPTSFSAPDSLVLRRIRLDLTLSAKAGLMPVVVQMRPDPAIDVETHDWAELGIDIGKAISVVTPRLADIFTGSIKGKSSRVAVRPWVQRIGLQRHNYSWRISDSAIAYNFNPVLVAQIDAHEALNISAVLHVEVQKSVFGVFRKSYGRFASPVWYRYDPGQELVTAFDYGKELRGIDRQRAALAWLRLYRRLGMTKAPPTRCLR